jgi:zinc D-Ala-D-Ala carboxypeptidase
MGTISKNFSYREFEDSEIAEYHNIRNVISTFEVRDSVKALVLTVLQPLRDAIGLPIHINSGYRCPALNRLVGGVSTSQHLLGEACDIRIDGIAPRQIAIRVRDLGLPFDQMILYPGFIHLSHKLNGEQRGMILYNKGYKGEKI